MSIRVPVTSSAKTPDAANGSSSRTLSSPRKKPTSRLQAEAAARRRSLQQPSVSLSGAGGATPLRASDVSSSRKKRSLSGTEKKGSPRGQSDEATLEEVRSIRLSANSKHLIRTGGVVWCGCKDGLIHVIDSETGDLVQKIEGPTYAGSAGPQKMDITSIALVGAYVWVGTTEGTIRLWDATTYELHRELQGHTASVTSIAAQPEELVRRAGGLQRLVVTGSHDWTIRVWNSAGTFIRQLLGHNGWVRCIAFEPTTGRIWSGGDTGDIRIWDEGSADCVEEIQAHQKGITMLLSVSQGTKMWSGCQDGTVKVWSTDGQATQVVQAHRGWVTAATCVADMVWTGSTDKTLRMWSESGKLLKTVTLGAYVGSLHRIASRVWVTTSDKQVHIFRIANQKLLQRISRYEDDEGLREQQAKLEEAHQQRMRQIAAEEERRRLREEEHEQAAAELLQRLKGEQRKRSAAEQSVRELQALVSSLKAEIAHLEQRLEEEREHSAELRERVLELDGAERELAECREELAETRRKLQEALQESLVQEQEMQEMRSAEAGDFEMVLVQAKQQEQQLLQRLEEEEAKSAAAAAAAAEREKERESARQEVEELRVRLEEAERQAVAAAREAEEKERERQRLEEEQSGGAEKEASLEEELRRLREENAGLREAAVAAREVEEVEEAHRQQLLDMTAEIKEQVRAQYERELEQLREMLLAKEEAIVSKERDWSEEYENRLRIQKLELDDTYRTVLDATKMDLFDTTAQLKATRVDYNNVAKWLLSGGDTGTGPPPPTPPKAPPGAAERPRLLKAGFMLKKGNRVKNWKRRLFVVRTDGTVQYYAHQDAPKPRGAVDLKELTRITRTPGTADMPESIDLHTPARIFSVHFDNQEEEQAWLATIRQFSKRHSQGVA
mmetsp:Transcript_663/g.2335  ORF Transcript_663/g.2335 Transcript_663/m.2335 type:complete len:899 (+) Transcript_663:89-2785(+)